MRMMQENIFLQRNISEDNFILKELDTFGHVYLSDVFLGQLRRSYLNNLGSREKYGKVRKKKGEINQKV